jgi:hypothetical protein
MSPVKLFPASCIFVKVRTSDKVPSHEGNPAAQVQALREPEKSQQGPAGGMRFYPGTDVGEVDTGTSLKGLSHEIVFNKFDKNLQNAISQNPGFTRF